MLEDGTVKVFLNASGTANDVSPQLADFLNYLIQKKGESSLVKKIDEEVKKARAHEEWKVEYMTLQMKFHDIYDEGHDAGFDEGHEAGALAAKIELITKKLAKGKVISQIADELEETEEEVRRLIEEYHLIEKKEAQ